MCVHFLAVCFCFFYMYGLFIVDLISNKSVYPVLNCMCCASPIMAASKRASIAHQHRVDMAHREKSISNGISRSTMRMIRVQERMKPAVCQHNNSYCI